MRKSRTIPVPRVWCLAVVLVVGLAGSSPGQVIHRNGFAGRSVAWIRGEDTVRGVEKLHALTEQFAHSLPSSEHIAMEFPPNAVDPAISEFIYPTSHAPVTEELSASVWVKATRPNIELRARVVLKGMANPKRPNEPMTVVLVGNRYQMLGRWQRLELPRPEQLLRSQITALRASLGNIPVNYEEAYIDRLMLNVYSGPGLVDVYVDDLEIGPVKPNTTPNRGIAPADAGGMPAATPLGTPGQAVGRVPRNERGILVELQRERLMVGGVPFFFRAIRHSGTPLTTLREAGFNTVWFDVNTPEAELEEAILNGFWIVPSLPLLPSSELTQTSQEGTIPGQLAGRPGAPSIATARTTEALATSISRFLSGDSVLFWDLGGGRNRDQFPNVQLTSRAIRASDPQRPRAVSIVDGFSQYPEAVDMIAAHRWPLMTSLELNSYQNWLNQRRLLTSSGTFMWTWVQTHLPESLSQVLYNRSTQGSFSDPVGPLPEQIRLLTYIAVASGCRGLGYWSDQFLSDSHQGRDRLLQLALLNLELKMLEPVLVSITDTPVWLETNHPEVKAAAIRYDKGLLVLPIWMGSGSQFVPGQGSVANLEIVVPQVPNSAQPWEIGPGQVRSLQPNLSRVLGGTRIVLPEFDLTSAIVFTSDLSPTGIVVRWQDNARAYGPTASQWAMDLAALQIQQVAKIHQDLEFQGIAPRVPDGPSLLREATRRHAEAVQAARNGDYRTAYLQATRALRPLRILMRTHWENATRGMYNSTGTPYAVSFYTLPRHWEMFRDLRTHSVGLNLLRQGDLEVSALRDPQIRVSGATDLDPVPAIQPAQAKSGENFQQFVSPKLPGWTIEWDSIEEDRMTPKVSLVSTAKLLPKPPQPKTEPPFRLPYEPSDTSRFPDPNADKPQPKLGTTALRLQIEPKMVKNEKGIPKPVRPTLERTYVKVTTPTLQLPSNSLVRISGWYRIPKGIRGSAEGAMVFDTSGGEMLGLRQTAAGEWTPFQLYRRVDERGLLAVSYLLVGIGEVYFDDLKVEPITQYAPPVGTVTRPAPIPAPGSAPVPARTTAMPGAPFNPSGSGSIGLPIMPPTAPTLPESPAPMPMPVAAPTGPGTANPTPYSPRSATPTPAVVPPRKPL
ncbi:hypothetical protein [Tuwongella immobilis]|uniref:Uncharacterized protein n=1 Tax=Tuwongella immobilis TaxID=692036 RepID=A0A6C2YWY2_9BACT|nr:hypothetical protein [Tuwongella immobilis]VIP05352.1 Uncharacterized protein OS=Planctomyces maris DSM 8797 GN=PM8797T_03855 PE=4 SV=1 [Tuwongella immobilis]VTS08060.1 Uncharacterized protein OS=Planctomyces maris DSM 8797 GN=PM8797T_03855 PE=4 SV=1 [Tuwongella immobilis]